MLRLALSSSPTVHPYPARLEVARAAERRVGRWQMLRGWFARVACGLLALHSLGGSPPLHAQAPPRPTDQINTGWDGRGIRGVTVGPIESSQQPGQGYGTEASAALLDELVRLGANTISITPFGRIWSLNSTEILLDFEAPHQANRQAIKRMIAQAHARGLRVVLIPHLWVETGGWRGEIDPGSPARWQRYHRSYRRFLLSWATDAALFGADALAIGVECVSWSGKHGAVWTRLIEEVRNVFPGPLTYSANWDEVDNVVFWDQLDWIGVNAFYPLARHGSASYQDYVAGATRALNDLVHSAQTIGKPAVLMEIGYTTRADAAVEPWLWPDHMHNVQLDQWEQARALAALMGAAARSSYIAGFFVWRYYANLDDVSQEAPWGFSPHAKLAERVLQSVFHAAWASDHNPSRWNLPSEAASEGPNAATPPHRR